MMRVLGKEIHPDIALELDVFDQWMCCKSCGERRRDCECNHAKELNYAGFGTCRYCENGEVQKVAWYGHEEQEVRLCAACALEAGWEV